MIEYPYNSFLLNKVFIELEQKELEEKSKEEHFSSPYKSFEILLHPGHFQIRSINGVALEEKYGLFLWRYGNRKYNEDHAVFRETFMQFDAQGKALLVEIGTSERELKNFLNYLFRGTYHTPVKNFTSIFFSCRNGVENIPWVFNPLK